jgi:hypothetical protein
LGHMISPEGITEDPTKYAIFVGWLAIIEGSFRASPRLQSQSQRY